MKKFKNSFVPFILFLLISFITFIIIRENVDLKKIKHKITITELRYPWLVITENNNSKWKVILEDTLKKKEYILIDTTVKSGELVWYWNYNKKIDHSQNSMFVRFYLNGEKLDKLNIRGGGCTDPTQYLDPPYK